MTALAPADTLGRLVVLVLLGMSVCSWSVILWKAWVLIRAGRGLRKAKAALWQAPTLAQAHVQVGLWDREGLLSPLLASLQQPIPGALDAAVPLAQRRTRQLREALALVARRLQRGHNTLATIGSVAPFVGLLGTVGGIHQALQGVAAASHLSLEVLAAPVGEALVMTAAGLVVAIPAVVGYNALSRYANQLEAELEGTALDLRDLPEGLE